MRVTCAALVDELRHSKAWYVSAAFFDLTRALGRDLDVHLRFEEREMFALIWPGRPSADRTRALRSLSRIGYRTKDTYAARSLRGVRELRAEVRLLERIVDGKCSFATAPRRNVRRANRTLGAVQPLALDFMCTRAGWFWKHVRMTQRTVVTVGARKWQLTAWCYVMLDEGVPPIDVGVMLSCGRRQTQATRREYASALRALRAELAGRHYRAIDAHEHGLVLVTRGLSTLTEARRERAHIERVAANFGR